MAPLACSGGMNAGVPSTVPACVGSAAEEVLQRLALDELHRQERPAVGQRAEVVDGRDAGVLQLRRDARLLGEAAGGAEVGGEAFLQHLDGDLAAQAAVEGAEDD